MDWNSVVNAGSFRPRVGVRCYEETKEKIVQAMFPSPSGGEMLLFRPNFQRQYQAFPSPSGGEMLRRTAGFDKENSVSVPEWG